MPKSWKRRRSGQWRYACELMFIICAIKENKNKSKLLFTLKQFTLFWLTYQSQGDDMEETSPTRTDWTKVDWSWDVIARTWLPQWKKKTHKKKRAPIYKRQLKYRHVGAFLRSEKMGRDGWKWKSYPSWTCFRVCLHVSKHTVLYTHKSPLSGLYVVELLKQTVAFPHL